MREERIGGCRLVCGDCRALLPTLEAGSIDAVVTDPPYGVRDEQWEPSDPAELMRFTMGWVAECRRIAGRMMAFFSGRHIADFMTLCRMVYPEMRLMFWDKPLGSQYAGSSESGAWFAYEPILFCHQGFQAAKARRVADMLRTARTAKGLGLGAIDIAVRGKKTGLCYRWEEAACLPTDEQAEVLEGLLGLNGEFRAALRDSRTLFEPARWRDVFSHRTVVSPDHPCEKPAGLMADILGVVDAQSILDPFMGSGSTAVACIRTGRAFIGCESDPAYFDIAVRRVREAEGVGSLFQPATPSPTLFPAPESPA